MEQSKHVVDNVKNSNEWNLQNNWVIERIIKQLVNWLNAYKLTNESEIEPMWVFISKMILPRYKICLNI